MFLRVGILICWTVLGTVQSRTVQHSRSLRIVGGDEAKPHEAPYAVYIKSTIYDSLVGKNTTSYCGGSLLSEEYILTARDCVTNMFEEQTTEAYLGKHDISKKEQDEVKIPVENFILHDTMNAALIKISPPISYTSTIRNISLPAEKDPIVGSNGTAYGWGQINDDGKTPQKLRKVETKIISNDECDLELAKFQAGRTYPYEFCTSGASIIGTCGADLGGPLVVDKVLVGMISWNPNRCAAGGLSVYIRVGHLLDWINLNTGIKLN